jgi:hypothetical protein
MVLCLWHGYRRRGWRARRDPVWTRREDDLNYPPFSGMNNAWLLTLLAQAGILGRARA